MAFAHATQVIKEILILKAANVSTVDYHFDSSLKCHILFEFLVCLMDSDCPDDLSCGIYEECVDPCPNCAVNSHCMVINHVANCICNSGYMGDAYLEGCKIGK